MKPSVLLSCLSLLVFSVIPAFSNNGCGNPGIGSPSAPCPPASSPKCKDPCANTGSNIINAYTGNASRNIQDLEVWGSIGKMPLKWVRTHNTRLGTPNTSFGDGGHWRHNFMYSLYGNGTTTVTNPSTGVSQQVNVLILDFPDGTTYTLNQQIIDPNLYLPPAKIGLRLVNHNGTFTLQDIDGTTYTFTTVQTGPYVSYPFQSITDSEGITYRMSYNQAGTLSQITDPTGRFLSITYGLVYVSATQYEEVISKITTSDGRSVVYHYSVLPDSALNTYYVLLTSASYGDGTQGLYTYQQTTQSSHPLLTEAVDPRIVGTTTHVIYDYVPDAFLVGMVQDERDGQTGEIISTVGYVDDHTPYGLDPNGRKVTFYMNPSANGNMTKKVDGLGNVTQYTYDSSGLGYLASLTDANNHTTTYTNSIYGNVLSQTLPDGTVETWTRDSLDLVLTDTVTGPGISPRTTSYTRDSLHRITRKTYPDASFETFAYNGFNEVVSHQLRNGGVETMVYDTTGLKTSMTDALGNVWKYSYDSNSRVASATDPRANTTAYQYTERGLQTKTTYADGSFMTNAYDDFGNRIAMTNEIGNTWNWSFDNFKRVVSATDPLNRTTVTSYSTSSAGSGSGGCSACNTQNMPTSIILPSGKETDFTYDLEWRMLTRTVGAGTSDAAATRYTYDPVGNPLTMADGRGMVTTMTYDVRNRKIAATDPNSNTTRWSYDAASNVLTVTRPDNGVTRKTWDPLDRLLTNTDPKNETTTYSYDAIGNLIGLLDANENQTKFSYDLLNRPTKKTYADGTFAAWTYYDTADTMHPSVVAKMPAGQTESSTLDVRNRVIAKTYSDSTPSLTISYDPAGRTLTMNSTVSQLSYTYDAANQLLSEKQAIGGLGTVPILSYTYDLDGNRANLTNPDGTVVTYGYTNRNQVSSISGGGISGTATYYYDLAGNQITKTLQNGVTTGYVYDPANRLTALNNQLGSSIIATYGYTYNSVDDRSTRTETMNGVSTPQSYSYDGVDQIISVNYGTGRTQGFAYDPAGNRQTAKDSAQGSSTTTYATNNLNQYTTVGPQLQTALTYDVNGNLSKIGSWNYEHDALDRFTSASTTGISLINEQLTYDARNRCVSRVINGVATFYVYDDWSLVAEYAPAGTLIQKYINGDGVDEILAKTQGGQSSVYYLQDGLGSTVSLTDSTGKLLERYTYDVYGKTTVSTPSGSSALPSSAYGNRFLFTGREYLAELNLYDYRNRKYSAELGRWIERDPIGENGGVNLYGYGENDPVNFVDPDGKCPGVLVIPLSIPGLGEAVIVGGAAYALYKFVPWKEVSGCCTLAWENAWDQWLPMIGGKGERGEARKNPNDKKDDRTREHGTGKQKRPPNDPKPPREPDPKPPYTPNPGGKDPYTGPPKDGTPARPR